MKSALATCMTWILLFWGMQSALGNPIFLKAGTIDPSQHQPAFRSPGRTGETQEEAIPERGLYLLQCPENPSAEWLDFVKETGAIVRSYIPENAYIVEANAESFRALNDNVSHTYLAPFRGNWKLEDSIRNALEQSGPDSSTKPRATTDPEVYDILLFDEADLVSVSDRISQMPSCSVLPSAGQVILARLTLGSVEEIAAWAEVHWIERYVPQTIDNNVAVQSPRMNVETVWPDGASELGLTGSDQIIAVADTGLDTGNTKTLHADVRGRVIKAFALGRQNDWSDLNGHGTHVVGSVLGDGTESDGQIKGVAYEAKLVFQSLGVDKSGSLVKISDNKTEVYQPAYDAGAKIHSDSWGSEQINNSYTIACAGTDEFMFKHPDILIVRSAGNEGQDANKDGIVDASSLNGQSPAKNCISVGNAENYRVSGGMAGIKYGQLQDKDTGVIEFSARPISEDYLTTGPEGAKTVQGMAASSSRGPCSDERIKPDIVAPGQQVLSLLSTQSPLPDKYSAYNEFYRYMKGTSMSTPLVAGAAALVRQWLQEKRGIANPDGATIKAVLLAGAKSLAPGQYGTGQCQEIPSSYPNNVEGWGQANLGNSVANGNGIAVFDAQVIANGETQVFTVSAPGNAPLAIVMAYTDAPGSPGSGPALVNNLDMTVTTPSGTVKYPNSGTSADDRNNVEGVRFSSASAGTYTITVKATKITTGMDSSLVGGKELATRFSLVANGAEEVPVEPAEERTITIPAGKTSGSCDVPNPNNNRWIIVETFPEWVKSVTFYKPSSGELLPLSNNKLGINVYGSDVQVSVGCTTNDTGKCREWDMTIHATKTGRDQYVVHVTQEANVSLVAPTSVKATSGTDGITVTWSGGSGASSYNVWRGTTSSQTASTTEKIKTGATSPYPDNSSDLEPGKTYYYWVEAVRGAESKFSNPCSGVKPLKLTLGSSATVVGSAGATAKSFSVTANASWIATVDKSWVTLTGASGNGNGTCFFNVDANPDSAVRTAKIVVTAGSGSFAKSATNTVNQAAGSGTAPANDKFANPQPLEGQSGDWPGSNKNAGMETSETVPECQTNVGASVWFTWTAPVTGTARFEARGLLFDVVLGVWKGTSVSALTLVGCSDNNGDGDSQGNNSSETVEFPVVANTTYRIAVYGWRTETGNYNLHWSTEAAAEKVTVSFESNGGTACAAREYTVGGTYGSFPESKKTGYTFDGWYSNSSCTVRVWENDTVTKSVTKLYAQWTPANYKVTLDLQGGTGGSTNATATYGKAMPKITVPKKEGYAFEGYYALGGAQYYKADGTSAHAWDLTSDTKLYAKWTAATYKVTLDLQGGTDGSTNATATYGKAMPKITVPKKEGYAFEGYYALGGAQYYKADGTSAHDWDLTSDTKLYAKWTAAIYISFQDFVLTNFEF